MIHAFILLLITNASAFVLTDKIRGYSLDKPIPLSFGHSFSQHSSKVFRFSELPFVCGLQQNPITSDLSMVEALKADTWQDSQMKIYPLQYKACERICSMPLHPLDVFVAREMIQKEYRVEWMLHNIPASTVMLDASNKRYRINGFPLGYYDSTKQETFIYNHVVLNVLYAKSADHKEVIIKGLEAYPKSVNISNEMAIECTSLESKNPFSLDVSGHLVIPWTFSIQWQENNDPPIPVQSMGHPVTPHHNEVPWKSVLKSMVSLLLLILLTGTLLRYHLTVDMGTYTDKLDQLSKKPCINLSSIKNDVFRAQKHDKILFAFVGTGLQLSCIVLITVMATLFNNKTYDTEALISEIVYLTVFSGFVAGYVSCYLRLSFHKSDWIIQAQMTALVIPCLLIGTLSISTYVDSLPVFDNAPAVLFVGFASYPFVLAGGYFASKKEIMQLPLKPQKIPLEIPNNPWYLNAVTTTFLCSSVSFVVFMLEFHNILRPLCYPTILEYLPILLLLVYVIHVLVIVQLIRFIIYATFKAEDYLWQWRSFVLSCASSLPIFAYIMFYCDDSALLMNLPPKTFYIFSFFCFLMHSVTIGAMGFIGSFELTLTLFKSFKHDF